MALQSIFKASGFKVFRYAFIIAAILTVVTIVALLTVNLATFIANWDATFGPSLTYANLPAIAAATPGEGGSVFGTGFTLGATFMAILFPMTYVLGFGSTNVGGELKDYKKSLTYSLLVTLFGMTAFYLLLVLVTNNAFGQDFLSAYGWLYWYGPTALKAYPPALIFFMNFGVDQTLLLLSALGMLIWAYMMVPAATIVWSRYVFAWSFDRVTPMRFGDVSERTRSPVWAILASIIIVWFGFLGSTFNLALVGTVYYISLYVWTAIVGISGILLARRKKELYQKSPIRGSVLKVQKVTWTGIVTAIYFIISIPLLFLYPSVLIPLAPVGAMITVAALVVAALIYFRAKSKNRAAGIDVDKIFKQIPPE
jgi:amino acid transporter